MIKLNIRKKLAVKEKMRKKRKLRIRSSVTTDGTNDIPRVCIKKSNKYIYIQVIDDENSKVITSINTLQKNLKESSKSNKNLDAAKKLGEALAKVLKEKGIEKIKFDRNGYLYTGRVKVLADAARSAGLKF